jgi:hypothetical protein
MIGGSIGHCTTGSVLASTGVSNVASVHAGSICAVSTSVCANGCADARSTTSCKGSYALADTAVSTAPIACAPSPD